MEEWGREVREFGWRWEVVWGDEGVRMEGWGWEVRE